MKITKLVPMLFLVAMSACDSGSDRKTTLDGHWKLINVKGGISGSDFDFPPGLITYNFDTATNTVEVTNNNTNDAAEDMLPSGSYTYSIQENTTTPQLCEENFFIDEVNFGCYNLGSNQLTFGQVEADGYLITLVR
ncbi:MAG: hypothetical protein EOO51_05060 [Flavobacterium sp.]|nr:MAG: hypothetical protein EOO51_05060 [Flavobacterium sp.]